ncbi:ATP-binding protein [Altericista sp. CCNU0014]|uniref:hybrid sensor histidine kinase/response regulator n=1 Tax=Altericista sp. CCNU0014 TaxID=3082949 RepID=UPI00384F05CC
MTAPLALLLLEDNEADACFIMEMLQKADDPLWQITCAQRLSTALKLLSQTQFDVALLDLSLPDSQGLDTLVRVREAAPNLPIIVLTGMEDRQVSLQALSQGAQDCLVKGEITAGILTRVIRYAIERGRILQQLQAEVAERQRSEQTLRLIVEGTASVTGEEFFRSLVRSLSTALNVRYALVSGCIDAPPTRVCTYAFWQGNEFGENTEYDLYGTPCEQVFSGQGCQYFPEGVQALFPLEKELVEMEAESYAGIPLLSSGGDLLGHLAVLDDKVFGDEPRHTAILEIFAARAAAEIERQQAEEALRISQEKFSKAFSSSPSAITISTLKEGRYIEVNESCLQMLGYSHAEMLGSSAVELKIWVDPEAREAMKRSIQEDGRVANLEIEFRKKSGEVFLGLMSAEVIQLEDEPCLLAVTTDITLLKEATKALERLAEIGELASMIVHEIRNPLTTLLLGLNAFKRLELPAQYQTYRSLALDEGERLQRLLNQILLYAKPQNLAQSKLELNHFVTEMLGTLREMPAAAGKHLRFTGTPSPIQILADPDKLKQVVINLVTNAFEAVEEADEINISLHTEEAHRVCLQVQNGGAPIPADVLPKLTKPFVTTKSSGTGLGLAIVKRIVEAHGGELRIESSAAVGTTVTVQLPAR